MWDLNRFLWVEVGRSQDSTVWDRLEMKVWKDRQDWVKPLEEYAQSNLCSAESWFCEREGLKLVPANGCFPPFPLQETWVGQALFCLRGFPSPAYPQMCPIKSAVWFAPGPLWGYIPGSCEKAMWKHTFPNSREGMREWWEPRGSPPTHLISFVSSHRDAAGTGGDNGSFLCSGPDNNSHFLMTSFWPPRAQMQYDFVSGWMVLQLDVKWFHPI